MWRIFFVFPHLKNWLRGPSELSLFSTEKPPLIGFGDLAKYVLFKFRSRPSIKYCASDLTVLYCALISDTKNCTGVPEEPDVAYFLVGIGPPAGSRLPSVSTCLATSLRVKTARSARRISLIFLLPIRCLQNAEP